MHKSTELCGRNVGWLCVLLTKGRHRDYHINCTHCAGAVCVLSAELRTRVYGRAYDCNVHAIRIQTTHHTHSKAYVEYRTERDKACVPSGKRTRRSDPHAHLSLDHKTYASNYTNRSIRLHNAYNRIIIAPHQTRACRQQTHTLKQSQAKEQVFRFDAVSMQQCSRNICPGRMLSECVACRLALIEPPRVQLNAKKKQSFLYSLSINQWDYVSDARELITIGLSRSSKIILNRRDATRVACCSGRFC